MRSGYACEMVGMGVQAMANARPTEDWVMLQMDVKTSLNTVSRTAIWAQATIPVSKGGLGVRDPERCWDGARVPAIVGFHAKASKLVGLTATLASFPVPDTHQVLTHLSSTLGQQHDPISQWVLSLTNKVSAHFPSGTQGLMSTQNVPSSKNLVHMEKTKKGLEDVTEVFLAFFVAPMCHIQTPRQKKMLTLFFSCFLKIVEGKK